MPGIEPGAFHMQSERATTALHPLLARNVPNLKSKRKIRIIEMTCNVSIAPYILSAITTKKNFFSEFNRQPKTGVFN